MENILFYEFIIEWYTHVIIVIQSNPRIYKPTNLLILRKPRKLNPTKIKYFTVVTKQKLERKKLDC